MNRRPRPRLTTTQRGYGHRWQRLRLTILNRDAWTCHYCGNPANSVDHVTPKVEGGTDHPTNLVASCIADNSRRSLEWVTTHRGHVRQRPRPPRSPRPPTGALTG